MAEYFLVLDAAMLEERVRPALAESWRRRNFEPCRSLCADLLPAARAYYERYHAGTGEPLLCAAAEGLPFDRACWRALAGEFLLFAARDIPELQTNADTLCCLLAPEQYRAGTTARADFAPIQQALWGSRDLTFGTAVYRPEYAGYNDRADVARLAGYLDSVRPEEWTVADLCALRGADDAEDRADELAFAREWFPALRDLYARCRESGCVLVHESIY